MMKRRIIIIVISLIGISCNLISPMGNSNLNIPPLNENLQSENQQVEAEYQISDEEQANQGLHTYSYRMEFDDCDKGHLESGTVTREYVFLGETLEIHSGGNSPKIATKVSENKYQLEQEDDEGKWLTLMTFTATGILLEINNYQGEICGSFIYLIEE